MTVNWLLFWRFQLLDPSGVVLDIACGPLREYLRSREDTVRCVVKSLTDEENTEMQKELATAAEDDASGEPIASYNQNHVFSNTCIESI